MECVDLLGFWGIFWVFAEGAYVFCEGAQGFGGRKCVFELKTSKVRKNVVFARACSLAGVFGGFFATKAPRHLEVFAGNVWFCSKGINVFCAGGLISSKGIKFEFGKVRFLPKAIKFGDF